MKFNRNSIKHAINQFSPGLRKVKCSLAIMALSMMVFLMFLLIVLVMTSFLCTIFFYLSFFASFRTAGSIIMQTVTIFRELVVVVELFLIVMSSNIFLRLLLNVLFLILHLKQSTIIITFQRLQQIQIKFLIISLFTINFSSSSKHKFQKYMKMKSSSNKIAKYQSGNLILKSTEDLGGLVSGDCNSAMDKKIHKQFKIQTVISIGQQAMPIKSKLPQNCNHYFYVIHDNKSQKVPPQLFDEINKLIEQGREKGGVLVHCYAGVSRSSTFVIGYIMQKFKRSYDKAREEVKAARNCIHPNDGFVHHLKTYQKALQKRQQQRLRRLQELRRLEIDKSLVQSARKSIRGGVRGAGLSPQQGKEMSHQGRKNYQQFIIEAIEMKNQLKSVKEERDDSEMAKIKNNIPLDNIKSKNSTTERINYKNIFFTKPIVNSAQRKQEVKLPKMNEKIIGQKDTQRRIGIKSEFQMQKKQKIKPLTTLMKSISISRDQILKKSSTANELRKGSQDSTIRSQNRTVCMKDSRSVFSVAKQKSFSSEVDLGLLNEHEKRVKKIYETKVIVK